MHQRLRPIINLRGFNINLMITHHADPLVNPKEDRILFCNIAIMSPRAHWLETTPTSTDFNSNFFRHYGQNAAASRNVSFTDPNTDYERHILPINVDKWNVIMNKRFKLCELSRTAEQSGVRTNYGKSWKTFEKYIKVNRQIRYDGNVARPPVYLVMWFGHQGHKSGGTSPCVTIEGTGVTYYREPVV